MNENVKAFLQKLVDDKELQARLSKVKNPDEAYEVAKSVQEGFTKEEFVAEMRKLKEKIAASKANQELSDEDVAQVAGGSGGDIIESIASILSVIESALALGA